MDNITDLLYTIQSPSSKVW